MKRSFFRSLIVVVMVFGFTSINEVNANVKHPFFVSVTEMNFNQKTNNLEISCKMFVDDIQNILKLTYKKHVDLSNEKQQAENNKFLKEYLIKNLSINTDAKTAGLNFIGFEIESESVYCYFEAENVSSPKKVMVTNKILQDYKKEQINIMHIIVKGNRKSTKTDSQSTQATLLF